MKKGNKQCLFDTPPPHSNGQYINDVRIPRPKEQMCTPYHSTIITPNKNMQEKCLSSNNCHFVKNYLFQLLTSSGKSSMCLYSIVKAKYPIALSKAVLEANLLVPYIHYHSTSKTLYIQVLLAVTLSKTYFNPDSFKYMFNVSALWK